MAGLAQHCFATRSQFGALRIVSAPVQSQSSAEGHITAPLEHVRGKVFICTPHRISHGEQISFFEKKIIASSQHDGKVCDIRAMATFEHTVLFLGKGGF